MAVAEAELEQPAVDFDAIEVPKGYELFDGELVEKPNVSNWSSWVAGEVFFKLKSWSLTTRLGVAFPPETEFACFAGGAKEVRKPDCSFVVRDPDAFEPTAARYKFAPDLVVEVLSPTNAMGDMFDRLSDFFSAGTKLAWLIDPERRFALVYSPNFSSVKVAEGELLTADGVLPGFAMPLTEVLPKRATPS